MKKETLETIKEAAMAWGIVLFTFILLTFAALIG